MAEGRINVIWAIAEGRYKPDEAAARLFYECNLCGACTVNCSMESEGFDPMKLLEDFRVALVDAGIGPLPEHKPLLDSIKNYDNPWVQPRSRKEAWFKGIDDVRKARDLEKFEVLFYPGCTYALDPKLQDTLKTMVKLLIAGKSDFAVLGKDEVTCGSTPKRIGVQAMFEDLASRNIKAFNELAAKKGVKTIVTPCAGCYSTFKEYYPDVDELKSRVLHITEYIAELLEQGKLKPEKSIKAKVTYHDPCHLGRIGEVFDAPRKILTSIPGIELVEMGRIREHSFCCGSGGGVKTGLPDFALETGEKRVTEAEETGAGILASACPFCEQHLADALESKNSKLKLKDVLELLAESVGTD
jgi:heterodisulfide reductase subunit D